ncbi:MAG TPA: SRPBCC family protein [Candidatus Limnocylindrales bacterium]|nr:SRPBCC family protein [Candidatus Limnocylindrales bacterium]
MRTDAADDTVVARETVLRCSPDEAWRWWTEPDRLVQWMGATADIDLRPDGAIRIAYGNGAVMLGEVVRLDAPRAFDFTWGWEDPAELIRPGGSRVEVRFEPTDVGTRVRVRHLDLPDGERAGHAEGWDYFLGRLGGVAG